MQRVVACVFVGIALSASAADPAPELVRETPFTHLGAARTLALRGDGATATVDFGARSDELATRAAVRLRFTVPAAAPAGARIRVALNDQAVGAVPLGAAAAGEPLERVVEVDPRLVVGFNRLAFTLEGAADVDLSGSSEVALTLRPLAVADDLALLPEPFFDRHDNRQLVVPFSFASHPSMATLRAAGIVASWLGSLATWRGARFPAALTEAVPGHAIAFATDAERPPYLASLPPAGGPTLRVMTNPADGRSKLLVVAGRTPEDLVVAARALVLRAVPMGGPVAVPKALEPPAPRAAWDAPSIVRIDRAMKLGELVDRPDRLQVTGPAGALPPVRVEMRVPPDLDTGDAPGVPMRLKVAYTPPGCATDARLELGVDGQVFATLALPTPRGPVVEVRNLAVPGWRLSPRTRLDLGLRYVMKDGASCREAAAEKAGFAVAPESTIDFSGFDARARMPDLAAFARLGYPFTRHADLAGTVVVLPPAPAAGDISAMLGLLGRMGEATGAPATRVRVAGPDDAEALRDADLLVIGTPDRQPLLSRWAGSLPVGLGRERAVPVRLEGAGAVATVLGFESPLAKRRSVVAVTSVAPSQIVRVLDALDDEEERDAFGGSAAFVLPGRVQSVSVGRAYVAGAVPPWEDARDWLLERPEILAGLAGFAAALLILGTWGAWRLAAAREKAAP